MISTGKYVENIIQKLAILRWEIEHKSKHGLIDINLFCERFVMKILNIVYGYHLMPLNKSNNIYPAIDLADSEQSIAVQVTATRTSAKIQDTIDKFIKSEDYKQFSTLLVFCLTTKQQSYTLNSESTRKIAFDVDKNILDFETITSKLSELNEATIKDLSAFIDTELTDYTLLGKSTNVSNQKIAAKPFSIDRNIHLAFADGTTKQLTFEHRDRNPLLLKAAGKIVFMRSEQRSGPFGSYERTLILLIDIYTLEELIVADQKPFMSGNDATYEIMYAYSPILSKDERFLYVIVDKYATGSELVKIDLVTREWNELFSTESFELLHEGPHKGNFIVGRSEIHDRGRDIYHRLYSEDGREIIAFNDIEQFMEFRSIALGQKVSNK